MPVFGARILEERKRVGLNQEAAAERCGVTLRSQRNYEKGDRYPDAAYLERLSAVGVDVLYVLTGRRTPAGGLVAMEPGPGGPLSLQEQGLLKGFRQLDAKGRQAVLKMQEALAHAAPGQAVSGRAENAAGPAWPQAMEWVMDALRSRGTPMPSGQALRALVDAVVAALRYEQGGMDREKARRTIDTLL